jgi:hypothetical protein
MTTRAEYLVGARVEYIGNGNKVGYRGYITDVFEDGSKIKVSVTFDLHAKEGSGRSFAYQLSSVECIENTNKDSTRYIKVISSSQLRQSMKEEKQMDPTINAKTCFAGFKDKQYIDSLMNTKEPKPTKAEKFNALVITEPTSFYAVCSAVSGVVKVVEQFKYNPKGLQKAIDLAEALARSAVDRAAVRTIFYVMASVSAHQVEPRPVAETRLYEV